MSLVTPVVVALDVGSSSVRALAFDAEGRGLGLECQRAYEPETTPDGGVVIDADWLVALSAEMLDGLVAALGPRAASVAAVATSTFWHTLLGVGADDRALTPVYSWADTRSAGAVEALRARVDEKAYHARVGCRLHTSYLPARLWWLRDEAPDTYRAVRRFMSFGEYLGLRLFGELRTSVSMASGTGLFDQSARRWDAPILETLELAPERLGPIVDLDRPFRGLRPEFAGRWPALAGVPWLPALGDGACSNVGAGCTTPTRAALMVGTSGAMRVCLTAESVTIPDGLWCYRVDGRRLLLGGSLCERRESLRVARRDPPPAPARGAGAGDRGDGAGRPRAHGPPVPRGRAEPRLGRQRAGGHRGPVARHHARRPSCGPASRRWPIGSR